MGKKENILDECFLIIRFQQSIKNWIYVFDILLKSI